MLTNRAQPDVAARIRAEVGRHPAFERLVQAADAAPEAFHVDPSSAGLEFKPAHPQGDRPSRCRLKLFQPREGKERLCAFFYKRSNLAWSGDRYSYGGVEFRPVELTEADARSWLDWLASEFDPDRRPPRLRRAFLYDIPD